jgi:galactose mutarotase-like enzyme
LPDVRLAEDIFGTLNNEAGKTETVRRFTLSNKNGMSVEIINYGATITRLNVPDRAGNIEDVVLGFDRIEGRVIVFTTFTTYGGFFHFVIPVWYYMGVKLGL